MTARPAPAEDLAASYRESRQGLLAYLRKQVSDPVLAEDLLQEVFVKALAAVEKGSAPASMAGWLRAITRNAVIDFYRARRLTEPLPEHLATENSNDDEAQQELSACLLPLARQLPEVYRDTLIATDFQGRTMQSLASASNLSLSAIKSRASRARKMLKEELLACCHVELSSSGAVMDYRQRSTSQCGAGCARQDASTGCCSSTSLGKNGG